MLCHVYTSSGNGKFFTIFPFCKASIIFVFVSDCTMIDPLGASITDIGSLIKSFTLLLNKILAGLVTGWTGSAFHITEDDLSTGICFLTMIAINTKIVSIIEGSFVVPV